MLVHPSRITLRNRPAQFFFRSNERPSSFAKAMDMHVLLTGLLDEHLVQ